MVLNHNFIFNSWHLWGVTMYKFYLFFIILLIIFLFYLFFIVIFIWFFSWFFGLRYYLKSGGASHQSETRSAESPRKDCPWRPPVPVSRSSCAPSFSSSARWQLSSGLSWHKAGRRRHRSSFAPGRPCRKLRESGVQIDKSVISVAK